MIQCCTRSDMDPQSGSSTPTRRVAAAGRRFEPGARKIGVLPLRKASALDVGQHGVGQRQLASTLASGANMEFLGRLVGAQSPIDPRNVKPDIDWETKMSSHFLHVSDER